VPLASFAANFDAEGGNCVIFVEYLDSYYQDSQAILIGSMFFQSIYAQYTLAGVNAVFVSLFVNKNALVTTYIGSDEMGAMISPFTVYEANILTDPDTELNGLPTFLATASGITDTLPYWHLDFNADRTIAWSTNCMTTGFGGYQAAACTDEPVLAYNGFDGSPLPASTGVFSAAQFGGYVVSGVKYTSKMCFGNWNCKFVQLYGVDEVAANNWHFGVDASYGTIGMGPSSFIWEGFVDPETKRATYSIELARVNLLTENEVATNSIKSNITFGGANDDWYQGKPSVYMPARSDYTYNISNFAFGIVYTDDTGADSSDFFYQLGASYPVQFSINFKGLGLPANLYAQFVTLFEYITAGDAECNNSVDGICTLPAPCQNYSALNDFYFKLNFTSDVEGNYMRVPLAAFSEGVKHSGGDKTCNVNINYLDTTSTQSSNIILGGMYFQEFFGVFINDYHDIHSVDQGTRQYVGQNSIYKAYIGNEDLPTGVNPFVPQPPSPP
jgi:hypothetical protein